MGSRPKGPGHAGLCSDRLFSAPGERTGSGPGALAAAARQSGRHEGLLRLREPDLFARGGAVRRQFERRDALRGERGVEIRRTRVLELRQQGVAGRARVALRGWGLGS